MAQLRIHVAEPATALRLIDRWWHPVRRRLDSARTDRLATSTHVRVSDLQGRVIVELDEAGALIELHMPPDTYHLELQRAGRSWRFTVALRSDDAVHIRITGAAGPCAT